MILTEEKVRILTQNRIELVSRIEVALLWDHLRACGITNAASEEYLKASTCIPFNINLISVLFVNFVYSINYSDLFFFSAWQTAKRAESSVTGLLGQKNK